MPEPLAALEATLDALNHRGEETTEKVDLLIEIVVTMRTNQPRRMLALAGKAYDLAERLGYRKGMAYALGYLGFSHHLLSDQEAALAKC